MDQCEYNLLNKTTTHVRQIQPENSYQIGTNQIVKPRRMIAIRKDIIRIGGMTIEEMVTI